ncbi:MAG: hypothetical protein H6837_16740 [Planctomycetes bacterium]|nr:hypothetical protein [Planctomycetota bacterium]
MSRIIDGGFGPDQQRGRPFKHSSRFALCRFGLSPDRRGRALQAIAGIPK